MSQRNSEKAWRVQLEFLFKSSNLPKKFYHPIQLVETEADKNCFSMLKEIHANIVPFVKKGNNLVLMSSRVGNGKTSWAVKLMQRYMAEIAAGNGTRISAYFTSAPQLFSDCSDYHFRSTPQYEVEMYKMKHADILVMDELGAGSMNKVNYQPIYDLIEYRINNGKCTIYTTNFDDDQLIEILGERLYSRIVQLADVVEFVGKSNRGKELEEIK